MQGRIQRKRKGGNSIPQWGWIPIGIFVILPLAFWASVKKPKAEVKKERTEIAIGPQDQTQKPVIPAKDADTVRSLAFELIVCGKSAMSQHEGAVERHHKVRFPNQNDTPISKESDKRNSISLMLLQKQVATLRNRVRDLNSRNPDSDSKRMLAELQLSTEDLLATVTIDEEPDGTEYVYPVKDSKIATIRANKFLDICRRIDLISSD